MKNGLAWSNMICILTLTLAVAFRLEGIDSRIQALEQAPARNTRSFVVTAYCPCEKCCGRFADGITASGHKIQPGDKFCAAPPEYKFGTMMNIPGYGQVKVLDRGGAIKGDKLDVFFHSHREALQWGRQKLDVEIMP